MTVPTQQSPAAASTESVEQKFRRLESIWEEETLFLSDPAQITGHWAFQEILQLGKEVVPFMLRDLQREPHLWVWALPRITGENPVSPADAGNIRKMGKAWLRYPLPDSSQSRNGEEP